ncbi:2912_t:CDS:2 [Cetraspora pellucida]|uniref:2912_t:CDS:1 n=1 Tax=Cetraspora pellucida TaxID=1433469 RepID=A0ACA9JY70_9GLOM|nr:2912_t:CDS:2 [Cetraspora pellucida]
MYQVCIKGQQAERKLQQLTSITSLTDPIILENLSEENIGSGVFVDTHYKEENQEDNLLEKTPFFDTSPRPVVEESCVKKTKKAEKEFKDVTEIKALLREIKYLCEDVNIISERVEASNMRAEIHKNWPEVKFERSRDQFEYNALCAIGHDLDLVLSALLAVELPQSKHEELSAYSETIEQAKQAASIKQGKRKYVNDRQFFRGSELYEGSRSRRWRQESYYLGRERNRPQSTEKNRNNAFSCYNCGDSQIYWTEQK